MFVGNGNGSDKSADFQETITAAVLYDVVCDCLYLPITIVIIVKRCTWRHKNHPMTGFAT